MSYKEVSKCSIKSQCVLEITLNPTPKARATKEKKKKLDYIEIKNFYASKNTTNRMERQPMEWEKIFASQERN